MCLLCQRRRTGETSVLQEVFHEIGLENTTQQTQQIPANRLSWRERRALKNRNSGRNSVLKEVLENL